MVELVALDANQRATPDSKSLWTTAQPVSTVQNTTNISGHHNGTGYFLQTDKAILTTGGLSTERICSCYVKNYDFRDIGVVGWGLAVINPKSEVLLESLNNMVLVSFLLV